MGDHFNPEVGFLRRRDYRKPDVLVMTRFRPKDLLGLLEVRPHVSFRGFWGSTASRRRPHALRQPLGVAERLRSAHRA